MTQLSIFYALAESNINCLIEALNEGLKDRDKYELISSEPLPNNELLLIVKNKKDLLFNIVNKEGIVPNGYVVNWRSSCLIMREFKELIPESVVLIRILEINKKLLDKGYDYEYIEKFWDDAFKNNNK